MKKGTKRLYILQFIFYVISLFWVIYALCNIQANIVYLILIGGLVFFIDIGLYDLNKGLIFDLDFNQFKKIWWSYVITRFFISVALFMGILFFIKIFNPIKVTIRDKPGEVGMQVIGGIIAGAIGFISAMIVHHYEQKNKDAREKKDLTNQLWFEILHNKILVEADLKNNLMFFRKLGSNCWNSIVSSRISIDGRIKGGISIVYGDIDFYNYAHQLQRLLIAQGKTNNPGLAKTIGELQTQVKLGQLVLDELKNFSAILFGEMVRLGYKKESDWVNPDIDWKKNYAEFKQQKGV